MGLGSLPGGYLLPMRLATFNILHGRTVHDGVVDPGRLAAAVRELDPDILALQEVDRDQPRSHSADLTAVAAAAMGAVTHRFVAAISGPPGGTWRAVGGQDVPGQPSYGIALLSRYPARSWQVCRLPRFPLRFPWYVPGARRVIRVSEEPRVMVVGHLDTPWGPLVVANTHLSFLPGSSQLQLRRIGRELATVPDPVVIMGDLNQTHPTPTTLRGYRPLARHRTFPVDTPVRQLDHILLRGRLGSVTSSRSPELPLSDHRALVVDLALQSTGHTHR